MQSEKELPDIWSSNLSLPLILISGFFSTVHRHITNFCVGLYSRLSMNFRTHLFKFVLKILHENSLCNLKGSHCCAVFMVLNIDLIVWYQCQCVPTHTRMFNNCVLSAQASISVLPADRSTLPEFGLFIDDRHLALDWVVPVWCEERTLAWNLMVCVCVCVCVCV